MKTSVEVYLTKEEKEYHDLLCAVERNYTSRSFEYFSNEFNLIKQVRNAIVELTVLAGKRCKSAVGGY